MTRHLQRSTAPKSQTARDTGTAADNAPAAIAIGADDVASHRRSDEAEPESTGVPGVVSVPRSRPGDARRRQRKEAEDEANDRGPWLNAEQAAEEARLMLGASEADALSIARELPRGRKRRRRR